MQMTLRTMISTAALVAVTTVCAAQAPAFKRTEVQRGDLSMAGREVVQAIAEIPPGAESGRHTHPGEEVGYVLDGTLTVDVDGKMVTLTTGGAFIIPAGRPHNARNNGKATAKVLATYIIEKGKPVATPVK